MKKSLSLLQYVLIGVSALSVATMFFMTDDQSVGIMLIWAYILMALAIGITVVLPLINLVKDPQGALRSLLGLAVIVVVLGIAFAISSEEPVINSAGGFFENSMELKLSDTGLFTTYAAMVAAIVVVIGGEIRNSFK